MPDIAAIAQVHRLALLQNERVAASRMVEAYGQTWTAIRAALNLLLDQIAAARAAGVEVSPAWLFQRDRLASLQRQTEQEIARFARLAETSVRDGQGAAVRAALRDSEQLLLEGMGAQRVGNVPISTSFSRLPTSAVENLVGVLGDGSPLRSLLDELAPQAGAAVRAALITGVATGQGPRAIAQAVRTAGAVPLRRALTVSRSETLRAYRESSRHSYEASGVVRQWQWLAALGPRTCPVCVALHGRLFPVAEPMGTHPCCRCVLTPVTGEEPPIREDGPAWFARQDAATQTAILGEAARTAYAEGKVQLPDFVAEKYDPRWGLTRRTRSLGDALDSAG